MNEGANPVTRQASAVTRPAARHIVPLTAVVGVLALLLVAGASMQWASLDVIGTPVRTVSGTETEVWRGRAVFVLGCIVILLCLMRVFLPDLRNVYYLAGGAIAVYVVAIMISSVSDISALASRYEASFRGIQLTDVRPESGLYVTIAGAIALPLVLALQYYLEQRRI